MAIAHTQTRPFNWKYFPRIMIGIMLLVMAVNVRFITLAVATFPGTASADDFDTSNRYNAVMDADAKQTALGWTERASVAHGVAMLDLAGPGGAAQQGLGPYGQARRRQPRAIEHATEGGHQAAH